MHVGVQWIGHVNGTCGVLAEVRDAGCAAIGVNGSIRANKHHPIKWVTAGQCSTDVKCGGQSVLESQSCYEVIVSVCSNAVGNTVRDYWGLAHQAQNCDEFIKQQIVNRYRLRPPACPS